MSTDESPGLRVEQVQAFIPEKMGVVGRWAPYSLAGVVDHEVEAGQGLDQMISQGLDARRMPKIESEGASARLRNPRAD